MSLTEIKREVSYGASRGKISGAVVFRAFTVVGIAHNKGKKGLHLENNSDA